jgi:hypothetical protein
VEGFPYYLIPLPSILPFLHSFRAGIFSHVPFPTAPSSVSTAPPPPLFLYSVHTPQHRELVPFKLLCSTPCQSLVTPKEPHRKLLFVYLYKTFSYPSWLLRTFRVCALRDKLFGRKFSARASPVQISPLWQQASTKLAYNFTDHSYNYYVLTSVCTKCAKARFWRLGASLSRRRPGFSTGWPSETRAARSGTGARFFSELFYFPLLITIPPLLHTRSITTPHGVRQPWPSSTLSYRRS